MKYVFVTLLLASLVACNNEAGTNSKDKADSLEDRKDTLLHKIDSTADAQIDSIKSRAKELGNKFDSTIDARKDSLKSK